MNVLTTFREHWGSNQHRAIRRSRDRGVGRMLFAAILVMGLQPTAQAFFILSVVSPNPVTEGGTVSATVSLNRDGEDPAGVSCTVSGIATVTGTATAGVDFPALTTDALSFTATLPANQASVTDEPTVVPIFDDGVAEENETIIVGIDPASLTTTCEPLSTGDAGAVITIIDSGETTTEPTPTDPAEGVLTTDIPGLTPPQNSVGGAIEVVCPQGIAGAALQARCDALLDGAGVEGANSAAQTQQALAEIAPEEIASQGTGSVETSAAFTRTVASRIGAVRAGARGISLAGLNVKVFGEKVPVESIAKALAADGRGGAAGDGDSIASKLGVFVNGNVGFGDKDDTPREGGFDFDRLGVTVGADYRLLDNFVLGAAVDYSHNDTEFSGDDGNMDSEALSFSVYGTYYLQDKYYFDGVVSYGVTDHDSRRDIIYSNNTDTVNATAKGNTDAHQFSISASAGIEQQIGGFSVGPYVNVTYIDVTVDDFSERDGAGWALAYDDQDLESLTTALGAQLSYAISTQVGVFQPQARIEWKHEFQDDSRDIRVSFVEDPGNTVFLVNTDEPDRNFFNFGTGVSATFAHGVSGFLFWETLFGHSTVHTHTFTGGVRVEF